MQKVGVTIVVTDKQKKPVEGVKVTCKLHGTEESCGTGEEPCILKTMNYIEQILVKRGQSFVQDCQ